MTTTELVIFGLCLLAGWLRVHQFVAYAGVAILSILNFIEVYQYSGPWRLVEPNLKTSLLAVATLAALYVAIYWVGRLATRFRS